MKIRFLICFCLLLWNMASAQKKCKDALYRADKLFQRGQIDSCIKVLEKCIGYYSNSNQDFDAYRLLAIAHQLNRNEKKTRQYVERMLSIKPDYLKYPNIDPPEFTRYMSQFTFHQKLFLGIVSGVNVTGIRLKTNNALYYTPSVYYPVVNFQAGLASSYLIRQGWLLNSEFLLQGGGINHVIPNAGGWKQTYSERLQFISVSLGGSHVRPVTNDLSILAGLGLGLAYLNHSKVFFETRNVQNYDLVQVTEDLSDLENKYQYMGYLRIGMTYAVAKTILGLDLNYYNHFSKMLDQDRIRNNGGILLDYQYQNDEVSLHNLMLNVSLKVPVYHTIEFIQK